MDDPSLQSKEESFSDVPAFYFVKDAVQKQLRNIIQLDPENKVLASAYKNIRSIDFTGEEPLKTLYGKIKGFLDQVLSQGKAQQYSAKVQQLSEMVEWSSQENLKPEMIYDAIIISEQQKKAEKQEKLESRSQREFHYFKIAVHKLLDKHNKVQCIANVLRQIDSCKTPSAKQAVNFYKAAEESLYSAKLENGRDTFLVTRGKDLYQAMLIAQALKVKSLITSFDVGVKFSDQVNYTNLNTGDKVTLKV